MSDFSNTMTTKAAQNALANIDARLIPPAVMGYRCLPIDRPGLYVTVRLYRSSDHDERGVWCAEGNISSGDGSVYWWTAPPADVLEPESQSHDDAMLPRPLDNA